MVRWTGRGDGIYFLRTNGETTDIWKVPIDLTTGRAAGEARSVLAGFSVGDRLGISDLVLDDGSAVPIGWSADSNWICVATWAGPKTRVLRVPVAGGAAQSLFEVPFEISREASVSLDGETFVFTRIDRSGDVWLAEHFDEDVPSP